jgi:hypothetical protein
MLSLPWSGLKVASPEVPDNLTEVILGTSAKTKLLEIKKTANIKAVLNKKERKIFILKYILSYSFSKTKLWITFHINKKYGQQKSPRQRRGLFLTIFHPFKDERSQVVR